MDGKPSLTTERNPLHIGKTFKDIPYYRNKSRSIKDIIQGNPYHIIEINPLLYKETSYCGREAFPYYRRESKEPFKKMPCYRTNPLLRQEIPCYRRQSLTIEGYPLL